MAGPLNVLIIEDNEADAALVERELQKAGFDVNGMRVDTAELMRAALRLRTWDIVISDHGMPQFSVPRALEVLKESGLDLPFIIVSGTLGEDAAVEAMRAGAHDYVIKGRLKRLIPAVERELREKQVRSDRRHSLDVLRQSEARFRAVIERLPFFVLLLQQGIIRYANPAVVSGLGYRSADDLTGGGFLDLVVPADEEFNLQDATRRSEANRSVIETHWRHHDGRRLQVELTLQQVLVDEVRSLLLVGRDVSEERRLQTQLFLSDRMASMGTLAAGVAHEINNPLAVVLSSVELTLRELRNLERATSIERVTPEAVPALLSELEEPLADAREAATRVRDIVRDLKLLSRSEDTSREAVDVQQVLETSLRMARNEVRHRARVVKDYQGSPIIRGNEGRLGQVFLNLLINAAQAIPPGKVSENEIRLSAGQDAGGSVRIEISDTGSGIPPDVLPRIFDPFFTTKRIGEGTGLGLAICQRIVAEMDGRLSVRSELGKGTTFTVLLPSHGARSERRGPEERANEAPPVRRAQILVIDDDAAVRKVVERALKAAHVVTSAASGAEALARLSGGQRFDVILCDLMMPEMTGIELYERLEKLLPEQAERFVFLTGGAFTPQARIFLEAHARRTLEKPFDVDQLVEVVRQRVR